MQIHIQKIQIQVQKMQIQMQIQIQRTGNGKEVAIKMNSLVTLARGQLLQVVIELNVILSNPVHWLQNVILCNQ